MVRASKAKLDPNFVIYKEKDKTWNNKENASSLAASGSIRTSAGTKILSKIRYRAK